MADYFPLISRAISALSPNTREAREAIYARAREALTRQLSSLDPPIPEADLWRERNALEETIRRVETQFPPPPRPEPKPMPPPMPVAVPGPLKAVRPVVPAPAAVVPTADQADSLPDSARVLDEEKIERIDKPSDEGEGIVENVKRPKVEAAEGTSKAFRSRRITGIVIALPVMLGLGLLAYVLRDDPAMYQPKVQEPQQTDAAAAQRKSDGRLDGTASQPPVSGPRPAPAQPPAAALPIAARAIFFEETASDPRGTQSDGQIIWRLETVPGGPGLPPETAARGSIAFPTARMGLEIVFKRNRDPALPASHTIELVFKPEGGRDGVIEIGPIEARDQESQPGYQLRGATVPVGVNLFLIGLDRSESVAERNLEAMRDQRFFAFQFRLSNNRVGAILLEKGQTGDRVFREASDAWRR